MSFGFNAAPAQQSTTPAFGGFGANNAAASPFGTAGQATSGGFGGNTAAASSFGMGGQQFNTTTASGGLFGSTAAQPAQNATGTSPFATAGQQTGSLGGFGTNTASTSPFGAAAGQQASSSPASGGLFGAQQNTAGASPFATGGQQTTGFGGFGASTAGASPFGAAGQQAGSTPSFFDTSTMQQNQQQNPGLFGQPVQQSQSQPGMLGSQFGQPQQQNLGASLLGGQQSQPQYSWGSATQSRPAAGAGLGASIAPGQSYMNQSYGPYGPAQPPSLTDQLQKIQSAWDPRSPDCAFQYYFYNKVGVEQAALYAKPAGHDQAKWDKAVAERPDNTVVPALANGFDDLKKRMDLQENQVNAYRARMHEIVTKLTDLSNKHDLHTSVKTAEARARHASLAQRVLSLAAKVQTLKNRGFNLRPEEEALRLKFEALNKQMNDPAVFGQINEYWARMTSMRERARQIKEESKKTGWNSSINWAQDEKQLEKISKILADHQTGIAHVSDVLKEDLREVDEIMTKIEERQRMKKSSVRR
ncbi:hypothetical protein SAICODRAFT_71189 [Saitoella complicata NRRL Y-17804]|uniref:Nucleoporin Nup54 alpha-helical domain-containing protein n=1 Tax=Saitoella complicata (strain BCRC 22490 / CBS 7301 / JCM 7358 / NBRC 10748 / NRRL Y-17804) TaxID=698492 RepID=A0A0E9N913_SAICN|nr:uncharacterized protein SAICODRAFT_71189 [Saitoella complicata NRRL Y-17804]ODQ53192.1 hypothetical protein SAICODRAFT_71189 [Saitoella complicata NRRL Y-17804]GAO46319.1 hypothetical protein G7K_0551-t1 [Saitoella complicata NRRL Y-17804]